HFVTSSPQGEDFKFALSASLPLEGKVAPKATDEVEKQSLNTPINNNLSKHQNAGKSKKETTQTGLFF
ncbi:MAG: hypothetical protein IJS47_06680, partial [Clostridia bacterium]|nr:hypothetical protein [Clostridia bacterium]